MGGRKGELDLGMLLAKRGAVIATSLRARARRRRRPPSSPPSASTCGRSSSPAQVRPVIHSRHPLEHAAEAHREMEASGHIGKILLTT